MRVLVTGGTGFLGRNLVHLLAAEGYEVTVMHRPSSNRMDLPEGIRFVEGDVTRPETLRGCCEGMDWVFHVAGDVTWGRRLRRRMFAINVDGTKHMVREAKRAGVKRFVLTSSAAAVGLPDSEAPADETFPFNGDALNVGYAMAKRQAETFVLSQVEEGLPAVVVNPGVVIGIRDYSPSFVAAVAKGKLNVVPDGGVNLCDVEDVARGHLLAAKKGRIGERYILGGTNLPFPEAFQRIADAGGVKGKIRVLKKPAAMAAALAGETIGWIQGREAPFAWDLAKLTGRKLYYCSHKAEVELGYTRTPLEGTIQKTVAWFLDPSRCAYRSHGGEIVQHRT